jgi:hypothetical protein|tara:strand:- start:161 stop:340 length:180 start_codon:yes stop_codon:yes gene_type:complete
MPTKFKESSVIRAKGSGKKSVQHFYMKDTPTQVLEEALERAIPKMKQKINNELVKRSNA